RARHASSFERVAVVSDEDWMRPALRVLSVLLPGKAKAFRVHQLAEAKHWLTEGLGTAAEPPTAGR
ncbi:MAG TPA: STAS/SEC14 domain-containing protein, partial [Solirubrobacterales bacterium]|nr:STAS/SEC14 domain-containing protein [Solirubrobacterales bacterium]